MSSLVSRDTKRRVVGALLGEVHKGVVHVTNSFACTPPYYSVGKVASTESNCLLVCVVCTKACFKILQL